MEHEREDQLQTLRPEAKLFRRPSGGVVLGWPKIRLKSGSAKQQDTHGRCQGQSDTNTLEPVRSPVRCRMCESGSRARCTDSGQGVCQLDGKSGSEQGARQFTQSIGARTDDGKLTCWSNIHKLCIQRTHLNKDPPVVTFVFY